MMGKSEREKLTGMSAYTCTHSFQKGDLVWVKDFRLTSASKWCKGTIKDVLGTLTLNVKLADGQQRKVHLDHLRLREKEWGVTPSLDEEMPKASTCEKPQHELDSSRETPKVSTTQQHPSKDSAELSAPAPLGSHAQACQGELPLATALSVHLYAKCSNCFRMRHCVCRLSSSCLTDRAIR